MKKHTIHSLSWFIKNIGKIVYRDDVSCRCLTCKNVTDIGLKIANKHHAEYLFMAQNDLQLNYRLKK